MNSTNKTIAVLGHSHVVALQQGWHSLAEEQHNLNVHFIRLQQPRYWKGQQGEGTHSVPSSRAPGQLNVGAIAAELEAFGPSLIGCVLCLTGNQHNIMSFSGAKTKESPEILEKQLGRAVTSSATQWARVLAPILKGTIVVVPPPPPIESEDWIRQHPGTFAVAFASSQAIFPAETRAKFWKVQVDALANHAQSRGASFQRVPAKLIQEPGFLPLEYASGKDPTHANSQYGLSIMEELIARFKGEQLRQPEPLEESAVQSESIAAVARHPYEGLPPAAYWRSSISQVQGKSVDPVGSPPFQLSRTDRIATAGSCFAQHVAKRLQAEDFNFMRVEGEYGGCEEDELQYAFSAKYGNIYTARQLVQLFDRSFGSFVPREKAWLRPDARFCDPCRPRLFKNGFATEAEVTRSSRDHLRAVRKMFKTLDVFVFTLGLTECFRDRLCGTVFPVAPGVVGGQFDDRRYEFVNFSASEIRDDLLNFHRKLLHVNPRARMVVTVSPVPLVATRSGQHVLHATTYSKAALRVAAEEFCRSARGTFYFPSYEIVTGSHAPHEYFAEDRRSVDSSAVDHVMGLFMAHMTGRVQVDLEQGSVGTNAEFEGADSSLDASIEKLADDACDEEAILR